MAHHVMEYRILYHILHEYSIPYPHQPDKILYFILKFYGVRNFLIKYFQKKYYQFKANQWITSQKIVLSAQ